MAWVGPQLDRRQPRVSSRWPRRALASSWSASALDSCLRRQGHRDRPLHVSVPRSRNSDFGPTDSEGFEPPARRRAPQGRRSRARAACATASRPTTRAGGRSRCRPSFRQRDSTEPGTYHGVHGRVDARSVIGVFVRRYAFYDQNIGLVLGDGEALGDRHPLDLRPGTRDPATTCGGDPRPGHGRRRHARSLRPRLRQRLFRPATIWGQAAACHSWSGPASGGKPAIAARGAGTSRPPSGRSSSIRRIGRSPRRRRSTSADGRSSSASWAAAIPITTPSSPCPETDVVWAGDLVENGEVPFFGDGYPLDWPEPRRRSPSRDRRRRAGPRRPRRPRLRRRAGGGVRGWPSSPAGSTPVS